MEENVHGRISLIEHTWKKTYMEEFLLSNIHGRKHTWKNFSYRTYMEENIHGKISLIEHTWKKTYMEEFLL